ncbi:MAG: DUF3006 domain-containing protein [Acutalibacteraceae bacterium]
MNLTVDRIEEGFAILEKEDMSYENVPLSLLPSGTKEGSVLTFDGTTYTLDPDAEAEARARIIAKQRSVFKKK